MLGREKPRTARVGVFGVGHTTYWAQFEGLLDKLMAYHEDFKDILKENEVEIIDYGMVDTNAVGYNVAQKLKADNLDLILCNMLTYATSSVFAPIVREVDIPIVMVALQPLNRLDCGNGSTFLQLQNDNICSVPEFLGVANRMGKKIADIILGNLYNDAKAKAEIADWCDVAKVLHDMKGARFALMGHVLEAMYDMHADPTAISANFGVHVPLLEIDDVLRLYYEVTDEEIKEREQVILANFDTPDPVSDPITTKLTDKDLYNAAKVSIALDKFVKKYELTGLAYYYNGNDDSDHRLVASSFIVGNSMLNAKGFPMCGEFDIKTCIAMFIMDRLDIGGSFAEFHPFDAVDDYILVGHDGPHHIAIAEGKPVLRSLKKYHGKPGSGASVEFKLKEGPITMLGITQTDGEHFKFIIGEGYSEKGPIPPTGNTNTRGRFAPNTLDFLKRWCMAGPTHHYALGLGHKAEVIAKVAQCLGIDYEIIR